VSSQETSEKNEPKNNLWTTIINSNRSIHSAASIEVRLGNAGTTVHALFNSGSMAHSNNQKHIQIGLRIWKYPDKL